MTEQKLKDCPFCGVKPITLPAGEGGKGLMIECMSNKDCPHPHTSYYDHAVAMKVWNTRATPVPTPLTEEEREAVDISEDLIEEACTIFTQNELLPDPRGHGCFMISRHSGMKAVLSALLERFELRRRG